MLVDDLVTIFGWYEIRQYEKLFFPITFELGNVFGPLQSHMRERRWYLINPPNTKLMRLGAFVLGTLVCGGAPMDALIDSVMMMCATPRADPPPIKKKRVQRR